MRTYYRADTLHPSGRLWDCGSGFEDFMQAQDAAIAFCEANPGRKAAVVYSTSGTILSTYPGTFVHAGSSAMQRMMRKVHSRPRR
jgi:hypothetical protein